MSTHSVKSTQENHANRRLSRSTSDRIIYADDAPCASCHELSTDYCQRSDKRRALHRADDRVQFYSPHPGATGRHLDDQSVVHCPSTLNDEPRRDGAIRSRTGEPRQAKNVSELNQCSSRRSSVQSGRSRANSCSRPTPLGNGRRSSTSRRGKSRRPSAAPRKDSVRSVKPEATEAEKVVESAEDSEQARRHRRIAMIVLGTFLFLLAASVLVVVVTLTHSTFLSPAVGSKELAEHRAQLRRENEELLNSLNRVLVTENSTMPP